MEATEQAVVREVRVEASPETLFDFFTDPEKMNRWMGETATLDPRPGGTFQVGIGPYSAQGEYVELSPPNRVVFTWGWEAGMAPAPGESTIEVTLEPEGEATLVRLVHRDLPEEARPPHAHGWENYLGRLVDAGAGRDPGPDRMLEGR